MFVAWSNRHCSNRHCLHALLDFLNYLVHSLEKVVPPIPDEWRANYQQGAWHPAELWPRGGVRPVHAEPHLVSHRLLGGSWFLKSFPRCQDLMDHLSHGRCCECLTGYTDTTKCSLSVDPGRVLWSLMEHLLTEVEAYMCQHLPDLYTAPAVCEVCGEGWGGVTFFLWKNVSWWSSLAQSYFRFIFKIFLQFLLWSLNLCHWSLGEIKGHRFFNLEGILKSISPNFPFCWAVPTEDGHLASEHWSVRIALQGRPLYW